MTKVYQKIAACFEAIENCESSGNIEWRHKHAEEILTLIKEHLPRGAGIDCGTKLLAESTPERLVFQADYHHMNDDGCYDGWTDHTVIVTPSLAHGFELKVTGRNRNGIKEYLAETFHQALSENLEEESPIVAVRSILNSAAP